MPLHFSDVFTAEIYLVLGIYRRMSIMVCQHTQKTPACPTAAGQPWLSYRKTNMVRPMIAGQAGWLFYPLGFTVSHRRGGGLLDLQ